MITEYKKSDTPDILLVINDAAFKYKGIIPDDCWREPYMTEQKLFNEFTNGVRMFGYKNKDRLIGIKDEKPWLVFSIPREIIETKKPSARDPVSPKNIFLFFEKL